MRGITRRLTAALCTALCHADIIVRGLAPDVDRLQLYELFAPFGGEFTVLRPNDCRQAHLRSAVACSALTPSWPVTDHDHHLAGDSPCSGAVIRPWWPHVALKHVT